MYIYIYIYIYIYMIPFFAHNLKAKKKINEKKTFWPSNRKKKDIIQIFLKKIFLPHFV